MRQCCECKDTADTPDTFTARCKKCFLRFYKFQELENEFCLVWQNKHLYITAKRHAKTDRPVIAKTKDLMHNYWDRDIYYYHIIEESEDIVKTANKYANDPNVERARLAWKMK